VSCCRLGDNDTRLHWSLGCALVVCLLSQPALAEGSSPLVIVLSWDGVRHDYPARGSLPGLERMEREGARAERLVPVFPTSTFPNHVSIATGTYPDRHGIVGNRFYDPELEERFSTDNDARWLEAEPLWIAAERQGVRAAVYFWVSSENDWRGQRASYRIAPFDSSVGEEAKLEQLLAWIDLPASERPGLVMSWWHGADRVGHLKGPDHPDVFSALARQDLLLQQLLTALDQREAWAYTTLIVLSDHGMTVLGEELEPRPLLEAAGVEAQLSFNGSLVNIYLAQPAQLAQLELAERTLSALPDVQIYRDDAVPASWRYRHAVRTGDLVLLTRAPRFFGKAKFSDVALDWVRPLVGWTHGGHAYSPEEPEMTGIFFARGRGVSAGEKLGPVRAIDVAASVSKLLGIEPPLHSEGVAHPALGEPRATR
jgi:arylsulfatase A-like enzyme